MFYNIDCYLCILLNSGSVRSDSVAESHGTGHTAHTGDTETTTQTISTVTGTNVPLAFVSAYQDEQQRHRVETLQKVVFPCFTHFLI